MSADTDRRDMEDIFYRKIMLYSDLQACLEKERECLVALDLNRIWDVAGEKDALCLKISALREQLMALIPDKSGSASVQIDRILDHLPDDRKRDMRNLLHSLSRLKNRVAALHRENVDLVDHSLRFIDEMLSIITGEGHRRNTYDHKCRLAHSAENVLLNKEI